MVRVQTSRMTTKAPQLLTVADARDRLDKTESGIRHMIFYDVDGFASRCVVRIGRSVRIREDRLAEFIEEKTGAPPYEMHWRDRLGRRPESEG